MKLVNVNEHIFREYDIRGIYGEDLSEDVAYTLGRSFGTYIKKYNANTVVVGRDNRVSSPILAEALIKGINDSGGDVINIGLVTTPMFYYARKYFKMPTGIMITASHNPSNYNGFKISFEEIGNAYGDIIRDFGKFTNQLQFIEGKGNIKEIDIKNQYIEKIKSSLSLTSNKPKVVVDLGNGTASVIVKDVMNSLGIECFIMNEKKDLSLPSEYLDPSIKSKMEELATKVKELKYDIGIALDGDADRVGVVDETGYILNTEEYMIIMYRYLNDKLKTRKALFDVKCGMSLIEELKRLNIEPVMNRTGNSYQNMKMQEGDFDFGGEYSGHLFFRDKWIGSDDGLYAGLRMVEVLSNTNKQLSQLRDNIIKYYSSDEIKIQVSEQEKFSIIEKIKMEAKKYDFDMVDIDGVRMDFGNAWLLIRASNTGPNITMRIEAKEEEKMKKIESAVLNYFDSLNKA